ncbi:hypothetical protein [Mycoplana sp. MJR14]|uniref:hypothetical protein n=1 Tax=Mycoplana sp. MJR14 TaxID=3032583 RepID=UPI0023DB6097|nr:hypothetical protein [Mycoplana sp. MJR14]MDF1631343.1 hypothetical protein [Mycoplana sp. MJR14]
MSDALKDLEEGEVSWLKKLADEEVHIVPTTVAERLRSLGWRFRSPLNRLMSSPNLTTKTSEYASAPKV